MDEVAIEQKEGATMRKDSEIRANKRRNPVKVVRSSVKKRRILESLRESAKSPSVLRDSIRDPKGYSIISTSGIHSHLKELLDLELVEKEDGVYSLTLEGIRLCDNEGIS
jgi:predicted transcriptional regulator